jgi:hypothetical protein
MQQITTSVWEIDPAFSALGETGLTWPDGWQSTTIEGGAASGNNSFLITGKPISADPYLRTITLTDTDGDGLISAGGIDTAMMDGKEFVVHEVFSGDSVTLDGMTYPVITVYLRSPDVFTAVSFPIDSSGKFMAARPGTVNNTGWSMDTAPYALPIEQLPCFLASARIATPTGPVAAGRLRAGDLVMTADDGPQPVVWALERALPPGAAWSAPQLLPICVPAGQLGAQADLWLSSWHRVMCRDLRGREVLVPLRHLLGSHGIRSAGREPVMELCYVHLALARHSILFAEGVPCESFLPARRALRALRAQEQSALWRAVPRPGPEGVTPARPLLDHAGRARRRLGLMPLTGQRTATKTGSLPWQRAQVRSAILT